ncbi:HAMP domain-containing histidine kinase [Sphingomonas sp. NBWT7]|uniref:sensor histidine kinase n=1 Tax=Sphingomonas sp. NBWT7 TaxID=2596913 RepID=UPI0016248111|nr:HAMP domain-containing sensor histidine kinase [Sphingomonas sp. NBWT7]QNE32993.1 HAMP domain-containing histidine kinase [Sphingomonas sp. NBWT7]
MEAVPAWTRSLVVRSALWVALIAVVATVALYVVVHSSVTGSLRAGLAAGTDADLAGLADIYATSGRTELIARIADRELPIARDGRQPHYRLFIDGRKVAGDLAADLPLAAAQSALGTVVLGGGRTGYARTTMLGPGVELLVAREDAPERATLRRLALAFAAGAAAIVAAVLLLATWRARVLQRRIARVNRAYRAAGTAEVTALIGDRSTDEIGELTRQSGRALARLEALVEAQRHVTDQIAHEIRTPLLHLETRLKRLPRAPSEEQVSETVGLVSRDVRGITALLESLLDIAATEAARGDREGLRPFDLAQLVGDLAEVYRGSMEEADLAFHVAIHPGARLVGDPPQIGRLLANLLDNAIKYVPAGGEVVLEVAADGRVTVADNGPGIPADRVERVFERFGRAPSAAGIAGHGLGLALARAIALRHDLSLTLEPSGRGCRFSLSPEERP